MNKNAKAVKHSIIHGNCLEKLQTIPDQSIDFVCADFPYNISGKPGLTMRWEKVVKADFWEWDKWPDTASYLDFVFRVCGEYKRVLKPKASMVLFFGYRHASWIAFELERRGHFTYRQPIILQKTNPMPHIKKTGFRSCMEYAVWLINDGGEFRSPRTFNFLGQDAMKSIIPYKIGHEGRKGKKHPTEKPLEPIARLIKIFSNEGDVVLDSFAGSWTTGIAATLNGRNAISIEQENAFIEMIKARQSKVDTYLAKRSSTGS